MSALLALAGCATVLGLDEYGVGTPPPDSPEGGSPPSPPDADDGRDAGADGAVAERDARAPDPCRSGERAALGACYFVAQRANFDGATVACAEAGAHLVSIASAQENGLVAAIADGGDSWIGFRSPGPSGNDAAAFRWIDGTPVTFLGFAATEPNEDTTCIAYGRGIADPTSTGWFTRPCTELYPAICERP